MADVLEDGISRRVVEFGQVNVTGDLLTTLKRNVLDSYAGISGSLQDTAMLDNFDKMTAGPASGSALGVWGVGRKASEIDAIFMNSILGRRSDLLDTYFAPNAMGAVHPSDNVALALTLADWRHLNGRDFIKATHVAFYMSAAFAAYYNPEPAKYDHDTAATFWTALTIGHVMGLSEAELTRAQRIAGMLGLSINQAAVGQVTDWKHCTYASCAMRAFQAVKMARAGFEAPEQIYEGDAGVNEFLPHAEAIFEPAPDLETIVFKRWPALVFCQTPIDVALGLQDRIDDPRSIQSVRVDTYEVAHRNGATSEAYSPNSRAGRTRSIPYCVATSLLKPIQYADFDAPRSQDSALRDLMGKIDVVEDPAMTKTYPANSPCRIVVTLHDGTTIEATKDHPKGDPRDPLSNDDLENKLRDYFPSDTTADVEEIIVRIWNIEGEASLDWLVAPLKTRRI